MKKFHKNKYTPRNDYKWNYRNLNKTGELYQGKYPKWDIILQQKTMPLSFVCGALFRVVLTSSDFLALFLSVNSVDKHQADVSSVGWSHKQWAAVQCSNRSSIPMVVTMIQDDYDKEPAEMGRFSYRLKISIKCCLDFQPTYLCSKHQGSEMNP